MARAKRNLPFEFAGRTIFPGERVLLDLEVAQLYTHTPLEIPIEVVHGKEQGPTLLVNAAIHGDELNGVDAVRQILDQIDASKLKGTLIAVPIVNVFGFIHKSRYLPDRRDLNRCFPGAEHGSIAARFAYQFFTQIVQRCSHIIDLHTGVLHRPNLPQIRANLDNPEALMMAKAFGTPVIIDAKIRDGSLRGEAENIDIAVITYEGGEALRFDLLAIASATKGTLKVMRALGMLRTRRNRSRLEPIVARSTRWVRAEQDGIVRSHVRLGARVSKGQSLATIGAPLGSNESELIAPRDGIVIGQQTMPLVNEGDAVFNLACFDDEGPEVEKQIEIYLDTLDEETLFTRV